MTAIVEQFSFKLKFELEKTPPNIDTTTHNPSQLAMFKGLFNDLGVEEDGRSGPTLNQISDSGSGPSLDWFINTYKLATMTCRFEPNLTSRLKGKKVKKWENRLIRVPSVYGSHFKWVWVGENMCSCLISLEARASDTVRRGKAE